MKTFGIDISKWQRGFDFDKAKAEGVKFVILRGAYSTGKDTCFEDFYKACKSKGIPVGVYHYSMAKSVSEAKAEANFLIDNVVKGKQFEYPIYMDVEDPTLQKLGKTLLTDIIVAFCDTLEKAGYYAGIYSTAYFLKTYTNESKLTKYDKWIAQWSKECTYPGNYGMWQYGGETNVIRTNKVAGVTCDQDYAYRDYPTIIKDKGLNGYTKAKPVDKTAHTGKIDGYNAPRNTNELILYVGKATTGTNKWGTEVAIDKDGIADAPVYGKGNMRIPSGGYVLSGHGTASDWILANIKKGKKVSVKVAVE